MDQLTYREVLPWLGLWVVRLQVPKFVLLVTSERTLYNCLLVVKHFGVCWRAVWDCGGDVCVHFILAELYEVVNNYQSWECSNI